jgi:hypothetical protein
MPRRDVVLTGLIAFAAGVAVGANWKKLRKKLGPVVEKCGLQMADLGDFLSSMDEEEFMSGMGAPKATAPRARRKKTSATKTPSFTTVRPPTRKKPSRRTVPMPTPEPTIADGTYGR